MSKPYVDPGHFPHLVRSPLDPLYKPEGEHRLPNGTTIAASDTIEPPAVVAAVYAQDIIVPEVRELFVDLDGEDLTHYRLALDTLRVNGYHIREERLTPSKTPGHFHAVLTVRFEDLSPLKRIALQLILGSDRKREMWSFLRMMKGDKEPTLFSENKGAGWTVVDAEDEIPF